MKTGYIYALIDPRDSKVRYIGRSAQLRRRLYLHNWKHSRNDEKDAWIEELQQATLEPIMVVLESVTEDNWNARELHWQEHFESLGAELLSRNLRDMAQAMRNKPAVKEAYRQQAVDRWKDPEWREKMAAVHKGAKRPAETGARIAEGLKDAHKRKRESNGGKERLQKHAPMITNLVDPDGCPVPPFNHISAFCDQHGLNPSHLGNVLKGKRPHHKGYRVADTPGDTNHPVR